MESESLHSSEFIESIPDSISTVTDDVLDDTLDYSDIPVTHLKQEEKIEIVRKLNEKGVFMLKGAVSEVAEKLQVSEATLYRYIRRVNDK
ncbi:MAG: helix-turn-helix domain-containing protein [Tissierella sp.]|uniref:helix-turn-helix domain-containing protein n=1 Tax=Tissierella sp. TaxID=41274 RepID=UPI003F9EB6EC